jgi:NAD(P)-dependent dehydrogenase (short-subunit alcohol dehydrogenase family)
MSSLSRRLDGRTAIVTGAGTGIGKAIAEAFADAGAHVVVSGRTPATIEAVAAAIGGTAIACDVSRPDQVEALFEKALSISGSIDVLVNNAGQSGPLASIDAVDLEAWRTCIDINLFGVMHCLHVGGRIMKAQGSGSIINMSSLMGLKGYPMRSAYSASKFAVIGMTEAVARELGPSGVRVNALCPGAVSGELMDRVIARRAEAEGRAPDDIVRKEYTDVSALRRWVAPEEVAACALFLASDLASSVTGECIRTDCGRF